MTEKQDHELMREFQEGSEEALEMIYVRYQKPVYHFSYRILANRADAEDATSETFVKVSTKKMTYEPKAKFSTWIFTIARNTCLTWIRKQKHLFSFFGFKNEEGEMTEIEIVDESLSPHEDVSKKDTAEKVKEAIRKLPLSQREAIVLREYHDLSYAEISSVLSCSLENVKILIYRGRENLRQILSSVIQEGLS